MFPLHPSLSIPSPKGTTVTSRGAISRLRQQLQSDRGIGMAEVIVALMVFSIIAVGMAFSLMSISRLTGEATTREAAANIAAAEIDRIQSQPDAFKVTSSSSTTTIDGTQYTINTSVGWVTTTGSTGSCGTGGGNLQYKRVNVTVTWPGMYLSHPVRADSALAPDARINDPSYGTILVAVTGEDGTGRSGATITVTPVTGGAAITTTIDPTDADGCSYILKVVPGTYKVKVSKTGYLSKVDQQAAAPSKDDLQVVAGSTATAAFTYDNASSFALNYASNSSVTPTLATNLDVTFTGGLSDIVKTLPSGPFKLYPMPAGYQAIAGTYAGCQNTDPALWNETTTLAAGVRPEAVGTAPGGTGSLDIPMGVLQVKIPNDDTKRYVTAVQQTTSGNGNPGCATTKSYTFPRFSKNSTATIALPYGTWVLYYGNTSGATTTAVTGAGVVTVIGSVIQDDGSGTLLTDIVGNSTVSGSTVTLDPRQVK